MKISNLVAIALVWLVSACASTGMSMAEREAAYDQYIIDTQLKEQDTVTAFRYDGWNDLSDRHLILYTSFNRPYLIVLRSKCLDLRHSMHVQVNNTGSLLQAKFDSITVPQSPMSKCFIKSIYPLTKEQRDAIQAIGKTDKEKKPDPNMEPIKA